MKKLNLLMLCLCMFGVAFLVSCEDSNSNNATAAASENKGDDSKTEGDQKKDEPQCAIALECNWNEFCEAGKCVKVADEDYEKKYKCNADYNCNSDYTGFKDNGVCIKEKSEDPLGMCKPRPGVCDPCIEDSNCGEGNKCLTFDDGKKYCGSSCSRGCPAGYVCDTASNQCKPLSGSCTEEIKVCKTSNDCERGKRCNLDNGICIKVCPFDRQKDTGICAGTSLCHQDGECREQCKTDADCPEYNTGENLVQLKCDELGRCAVDGCINSDECPKKNYCDLKTNKCVPGCLKDSDCDEGEGCKNNQCVTQDCVARGGANLACSTHQFCCGQKSEIDAEFNCIGKNDTETPCDTTLDGSDGTNIICKDRATDTNYSCNPTGTKTDGVCQGYTVQKGSCFAAPLPFCKRCDPNGNDATKGSSECGAARYGTPPRCAPGKDANGNDAGFCAPGCNAEWQCPSGWACSPLYQLCDPAQPQCPQGFSCKPGDFPCQDNEGCKALEQQGYTICQNGACVNSSGKKPDFCKDAQDELWKTCQNSACYKFGR